MAHHVEGEASWRSRCTLCQLELSGGWAYDGERVMAAILQYIDDWFEGRVPDEVETRRRDNERQRLQAEEWRTSASTHNRPVWKHG